MAAEAAMREKILAQFKTGELKYLVATGVAARGWISAN